MNVMYGHLDVFCIKCALLSLHLKLKIWMLYIKKFSVVNMKKSQKDILHNLNKSFHYV